MSKPQGNTQFTRDFDLKFPCTYKALNKVICIIILSISFFLKEARCSGMYCWIRKIVIQECGLRHYCFWFCCLKSFMKSISVLTSSSFTALYIDTLIPPTDLKMKDAVLCQSEAEMQSWPKIVGHIGDWQQILKNFSIKYFSVRVPILSF